jgi:SET domain-containing protein
MSVIVQNTVNRGKGVFASRDFSQGDVVCKITGRLVRDVEALKMSRYSLNHMAALSLHDWILVDPPMKFINHSCEPNVFEKDGVVLAMREIKSGDELFFDYAINGVSNVDDWRMKCKCGSQNCRGIIHGEFFRLPIDVQRKYLPFLDSWFVKEFESELPDV